MDFKSFKVNTGNTESATLHKKIDESFAYHPKVYQGCSGKCGTETIHIIIGEIVRCSVCQHEYKLIPREQMMKEMKEEKEKPLIVQNNLLKFVSAIR